MNQAIPLRALFTFMEPGVGKSWNLKKIEENIPQGKWQRGFSAARVASAEAKAPKHARKVGAVLFSGSIQLSIGYNKYGHTHTRAGAYFNNLHAEHRCLLKRQYTEQKKNNLTMYVYRETHDGKPACSRPCDNCQKLMKEASVKVVRFINEKGAPDEIIL